MKQKNMMRVLSVLLFALFMSSTFTGGPSTIAVSESTVDLNESATLSASPTEMGSRMPSQPSILVFNQFSDLVPGLNNEFRNTVTSIEETYGPKFTYQNLTDYSQLGESLGDYDIFLITEQEQMSLENLTAIVDAWNGHLHEFVANGGILIVMTAYNFAGLQAGATARILNETELLSVYSPSASSGYTVYNVNATDALANGIEGSWIAADGSLRFNTSGDGVTVVDDGTWSGVVHKTIERGHVVLLGFDLFERESNYDIILANSIRLHRHVVFDDSHGQVNEITAEYSTFALDLAAAGYAVSQMNTFDPSYLEASDVLVLSYCFTPYGEDEVDIIEEFVARGGGLWVITEFEELGDELDPVTDRFGFVRNKTAAYIYDSDDNAQDEWDVVYSSAFGNILNHSVTVDVLGIETNAGTGFIGMPENGRPLIVTDSDGTATWGGTDPALGVVVAAEARIGMGRVIVTTDVNMFQDDQDHTGNAVNNYFESDNDVFGEGCIRWLAAAGIEEQVVLIDESHIPRHTLLSHNVDFANFLTENGFTLMWMSSFYETLINTADVLMMSEGVYTTSNYSANEVNTIESFVAEGGGLFLRYDWGIFGVQTDNITQSFGIARNGTSYIIDSDNTIFGDSYNFYDMDNILEHPINTDVTRIEIDRGTGFVSIGTATPLLVTDNDATSTWYHDGSPADEVVMIAAAEHGMGRVVVIPDVNMLENGLDVDGDGLGQMYAADNEIFLRNAFLWLSANRAPMVEVLSPNGGETLSGEVQISWSAMDYDSDTLQFIVFYSANGGSSWTAIADGLTATTLGWDTTMVADGDQYLIRVVAHDEMAEGADTSDAVFSIDNPEVTTTPTTPTDGGLPLDIGTMIIIIAAIGGVILIVVVFLLRGRGAE
ncbi:MAG: hypothetical protein ACXADF_01335 [Candidatus Thorarchaeota archaeon]|jgi:uncharacterized membrane protein